MAGPFVTLRHTDPVPTHHVLPPGDRPDIEVSIDDTWHPGELRMWTRADDGTRAAQVQWRAEAGMTRIDTVPAERVRPVEDPNS